MPRDVHLVPFFVVALLVIVYILWIGPGDYFLLRRLGRGMHWTWITFPLVVVMVSVGAYLAANWLKGNQIRVCQVDLVDIDAGGTARGASWFSIFSPRGESFDLTLRPRLPGGLPPEDSDASLGWFGKGDDSLRMYGGRGQNAAPMWGQSYAIPPSLDAVLGAPIQVWASKSFVQRWLGRAADVGVDASLQDDGRQLSGTVTNRLKGSGSPDNGAVALSRCYLVYGDWVYTIDTLNPGESVTIGPETRRVSLSTFFSEESSGGPALPGVNQTAYDRASREMDYVLQAMLFYNAANGRKRTHLSNASQGFTDLSGLLKAGRAVLVAMPPQDGSCRGGDLLRGLADNAKPLGNALDKHTTIYRFVLPVANVGDASN